MKTNIGIGDSVLNTLRTVREELLNEVASLSDNQLNMKPSEEKWSVSQVIQHLSAIDESLLPALKNAVKDESERVEEKDVKFVLDRTKKRESPLPEPSAEFISKEGILKMLNQARIPLIEFTNENIDGTILEDKSMVHPFLGQMSIKQMIEVIALHEKRHIDQVKEIKESIVSQKMI
ncbi:DinB family protein [Mesobacillus zeae]|uniref:DinB family protein n=1 Tax=Mesobacillus zeae TaxID=1917180 RepID=A0A398B4U5_9BACI|nr:DinB family protein [Mesobacillus zeae]RID82796.1 DinB family protein [Mesobacillus zeae]